MLAVFLFVGFLYWGYLNFFKNPENVNDNNVRFGVGGGPGFTDYSYSPTQVPGQSQTGVGGGPGVSQSITPSPSPKPSPSILPTIQFSGDILTPAAL